MQHKKFLKIYIPNFNTKTNAISMQNTIHKNRRKFDGKRKTKKGKDR